MGSFLFEELMECHLTRRRLIRQFILGTAASWCAGVWKTETLLAVETPAYQDDVTLRHFHHL